MEKRCEGGWWRVKRLGGDSLLGVDEVSSLSF
jgi:hypothetical protein